MDLATVVNKAAAHGFRHLAQAVDYHLERGLAAPTKVTMTLTHRCNCRCVMCDLWKFDDPTELSSDRWMALLDELHAWIGTFRAGIGGGEVFLKPGCYDVIRHAVDLGLTVDVVSNGLLFNTERHFQRLLDTGLKSISFSLDGKDASVHDRHRGISGLHAVVTDVVRRIKRERPSMSVSVLCIIMKETVDQLADFARWAADLGVDNVLFQPISSTVGRLDEPADWHRHSPLFVDDLAALARSMDGLVEAKRAGVPVEVSESTLRTMQEYFARPEEVQMKGRHCMLGQTDLRINPQGLMYMCDVGRTTIGSVDDGLLRDTWRGVKARAVRQVIKACQEPCASLCHRSPGLREQATSFVRFARAGKL